MTPQLANAYMGPNATKGIGDVQARQIERAFKKEIGWLDHDHNSSDTDSSNTGQYNALSKQALNLISCVEELDKAGDLARSTFILHTGLLRLSAAESEIHTGSARAEMIAELERLIGSSAEISGATDDRKPKRK
jgi:hypothetical protein